VSDLASLRDSLAAQSRPDGGWGYAKDQPAHPEPTCLALMALAAELDRFAQPIAAGRQALEQNGASDGSYRLSRGRSEAAWPTALALFTRSALAETSLDRSIARLKAMRGRVLQDDPEFADTIDIDVKLIGWPWAEGNFSWVEPTAWACLALRKAGQGRSGEVCEGLKLLLDRAFDEGGVNYGNRKVLGRMTEPIPTPTALMLLAVQGVVHPRVAAALGYLRKVAGSSPDLEHLGWSRLAFAAHGDQDSARRFDELIHRSLVDQQYVPPVRLALAVLALDSDRSNPFRLTDAPALDAASNPANSESRPSKSLLSRVSSKVRGMFVNGLGSFRPPPLATGVHIATAPDYDGNLKAILLQQYEHFRAQVPLAGKRVVLKPNLVEHHPGKVINTNPRVIEAAIELCKTEGAAEVIVAEGPGHWRNVQFLVEQSGLGEVLRRHNVRFVDLNHDEPVKMLNLGRLTGLDYLYLAQTVVECDVLISMPKLKTHHWAGATLSLKNLFGILPGICYGWPKNELHWRGIPNSIVDIALTRTPHLAIVDGIVGMEGDGPLNGTAKPMGVLVMGDDLPAVDATCCRLMALNPRRIPYLLLAERKRLGRLNENEIPQLGEPIAAKMQPFALPPKVDKHLVALPA
jgi:uncharacterized protein (DUF362 family)